MKEIYLEKIKELSGNCPVATQAAAINALSAMEPQDAKILVLPGTDKSTWENAAICITRLNGTNIVDLFPEVFDWLQDLNWPGAEIIFDFLSERLCHEHVPHLTKAMKRASELKDEDWLRNLQEVERRRFGQQI